MVSKVLLVLVSHTLTTDTGCDNDTANVELVNWDTGVEYICSDIPLLPDLTPETSTCDIEKDQMVSGTWGLILISNNGDGDPLAVQRTFSLTVGTQVTATVSFWLRCLMDSGLTRIDYTNYDFQYDDYSDCYISFDILGCQHYDSQQH